MATKYPTLKRPKRKLCYVAEKESSSKQWDGAFTLADVDKMFDDIDVCSNSLHPPSPLLQSSDSGTCSSEVDILSAASKSTRAKLDNVADLEEPLKLCEPVKTSSPVKSIVSGTREGGDGDRVKIATPIILDCENDVEKELGEKSWQIDKPQEKGVVTQESFSDYKWESPPSLIALTHALNLVEKSEKTCETNATPTRPAMTQALEVNTSRKSLRPQPVARRTSQPRTDMSTLLQKLKQSLQSETKNLDKTQVEAPSLPEQEEDFLILEDEAPSWFSIPFKNASSRRQRPSLTSSTSKESPSNEIEKDKPVPAQEGGTKNKKLKSPEENPVSTKIVKKTKGRKKTPGVTEEETHPQDLPDDPNPPDDFDEPKEEGAVGNETKKDEPPGQTKTEPRVSSVGKRSKDGKQTSKVNHARTVKKTKARVQETGSVKNLTDVAPVETQMQERNNDGPVDDPSSFKGQETNRNTESVGHPAESEETSSDDHHIAKKRERKRPGQWWKSQLTSSEDSENIQPPEAKKTNTIKWQGTTARRLSTKTKKRGALNSPVASVRAPNKQKKVAKVQKAKQMKKNKGRKEDALETVKGAGDTSETEEMQQIASSEPEQEQEDSGPQSSTPKSNSRRPGVQTFQSASKRSSTKKTSTASTVAASRRKSKEVFCEPQSGKRRRKAPGNWWEANSEVEDLESIPQTPSLVPTKTQKPRKEHKKQPKGEKPAGLGVPKTRKKTGPLKPAEGALGPPPKPPKARSVKRSLINNFTQAAEKPIVGHGKKVHQNHSNNLSTHTATDCATFDEAAGSGEGASVLHSHRSQSDNTLKAFRSGPSSMIVLEQYEEDDSAILPSSRIQHLLCASDFCAPPLKPLTLHPKDKANLSEWFQTLWSSSSEADAIVTPDRFEWFCYRDRAIGFQVDISTASICSGKMLLGSHMKKPLWVDHSATTVFNLLTSSVTVKIDSNVTRYLPGQSFIVECGRAYSLQNCDAQPAVLYFSRILAECSD